MTRLEEAAITLHEILWKNTGDNADWPIIIHCDPELEDRFINALNELGDAIKEVKPGSMPWPL